MTQQEIADALGVSQPTVAGYVARGCPTDSIEAVRAWMDANLAWRKRKGVRVASASTAPAKAGSAVHSVSAEMMLQRLRRETAEAQAAEMRVAEQCGELVRADEVRAALARRITFAREFALGVPSRVAPLVYGASSLLEVETILAEQMHAFLATLAEAGANPPPEAKG